MAVKHPRMAGEFVPLDINDQNSAARALNRPPGSASAPVQTIGQSGSGQLRQRSVTPNAPEQRDFSRRMALALWHGPGWYQETVDMLDGFFQFDGQQDRSCYILSNQVRPVPIEVMAAAQRAFIDVRVVDTMFGNPEDGRITPYALYDFAGLITQRDGHKARVFYTMPLKVVGPNSLARLEQEAYNANPGRDPKTQQQLGKPILGAVRETKEGKFPFSSFVALPTWVMEPQFPLIKGLSKQPITEYAQAPMNFLRFELMKNMKATALINPDPDNIPSDPRFVVLEGIKLGQPFPAAAPVSSLPNVPASQMPALVEAAQNDLIAAGKFGSGPLPDLPEELELEARVATEGLDFLADYRCPTSLETLKLIYNTEVRRLKTAAESNPPMAEPDDGTTETPQAPAPPSPVIKEFASLAGAPPPPKKAVAKVAPKAVKKAAKKPKAALTEAKA